MKRRIWICGILICVLSGMAAAAAAEAGMKLPPYQEVKLPNGFTLLLMEKHQVPLVSFSFVIKAGSVADPPGKEGIASLTAGLLRKGTKTRTADQLSAEVDSIGGQLGAGAGYDYTSGSAEFLKKDLPKGVELLADVLMNPTFPQEEVTKMLKQRIDGIKAAKDQAQGVINSYFNAYLYGNHPYGRPAGGDEKSLPSITRDDVVRFYETHYLPANLLLAAVGDFATEEFSALLAERFKAWPGRAVTPTALPEVKPYAGKKLLLVNKPDSAQTFFRIGNLGISQTDPDRVYLEVINTLFGGRFTSMINSELRIKSGLTYGAGSSFDQRKLAGPFVISSYTPNKTTEKALDLTLEVLRRLHEKGITAEELQSAKNYIKGQSPTDIETTNQLAELLTRLKYYGLGDNEINEYYQRIDAMTLDDARRVIKEHFPLDNLVFVLIGKAEEIKSIVSKYAGQMDQKSIQDVGF